MPEWELGTVDYKEIANGLWDLQVQNVWKVISTWHPGWPESEYMLLELVFSTSVYAPSVALHFRCLLVLIEEFMSLGAEKHLAITKSRSSNHLFFPLWSVRFLREISTNSIYSPFSVSQALELCRDDKKTFFLWVLPEPKPICKNRMVFSSSIDKILTCDLWITVQQLWFLQNFRDGFNWSKPVNTFFKN